MNILKFKTKVKYFIIKLNAIEVFKVFLIGTYLNLNLKNNN